MKFVMGCFDPLVNPAIAQGDSSPLPSALPVPDRQINKDTSSDPCFENSSPLLAHPPIATNMDESTALCLLGVRTRSGGEDLGLL